jgi:hypothetical protein
MTNPILVAHVASGLVAILAGAVAVTARKGGAVHVRAGTWFAVSMLILGITAVILEPFRTPEPGSPIPPLLVCYFVATSWVTARRRDGATGKFEIIACALALSAAAAIAWDGIAGGATTPVGRGPIFAFAAVCLLAGLGDLNVILRNKLTAAQRLSRHLWRMCFAFFIATGSFFLGQQDILPAAMRGSPILFVLAFAPFTVMAFWLVRLRIAKSIRRVSLRVASAEPPPIAVEAGQ